MSAEGVRGLCFINTVMNSHTPDVIQKLETEDATLPPFPALFGIFQHDNEDIHSPQVKTLQWTCI